MSQPESLQPFGRVVEQPLREREMAMRKANILGKTLKDARALGR